MSLQFTLSIVINKVQLQSLQFTSFSASHKCDSLCNWSVILLFVITEGPTE